MYASFLLPARRKIRSSVTGRRASRRKRTSRELGVVVASVLGLVVVASVQPVLAGASVNLDQWASSDLAWQNGNLNGNNSRYPEGGIVPFRLAVEGLSPGSHSIHINYDFTAGGHKAYDFLATWNVTNAAGKICAASGGGISSMCPTMPASSSAAFPSDSYLANGLPVAGAEAYSAAPRRMTIWGGSISSISGPTHAGSANGNSTADFLVRFTSTGPAVLLAWGGHLAQSAYWDKSIGGAPDGAAQVSGAPWHMRTLQLDGAGNKNQDRSIQPSAIVGSLPPFALAPAPSPTPRRTAPPAVPAVPGPTPRGASVTPPGVDPGGPAVRHGPIPTVPPTSTAVASGSEAAAWSALGVVLIGLAALTGAAVGVARRRRLVARPEG